MNKTYLVPMFFLLFSLAATTYSSSSNAATEPKDLPLFAIEQLKYHGAFRLPATQLGESSANWANGTLAYNNRNHSLFFVGHNQHQAIAEFSIPKTFESSNIEELKTAVPIQTFVRLFQRVKDNPDGQDRITGLHFDSGRLIINTMKYYDATASAKNTTIVISNAKSLKDAKELSFYQLEHGARAAGWMSSIPTSWRNLLKADLVVGNGNGRPINARLSIGPSALATNIRHIVNADITSGAIALQPLQLYSLQESLHHDLKNQSRSNKLLTELSKPVYGFIIPNTRTYMVVGSSGGHNSGVGYKLKREDGSECPGFCPNDVNDMVNYYWLFDVNNWLEVINGQKHAYQIKPYSFGELKLPFSTTGSFKPVTGATFNEAANILYLALDRADTFAGDYNNPPLILELKLNI